MNRALPSKPLGGLIAVCLVIAGLSACSQPDQDAAQPAGDEPAASANPASGNNGVTSIDAQGNVAPFGMASRKPVDVPPLEQPAAAAPATAANQSTAYNTQCVACHGADAKGIEGLGLSLVDSQLVADSSPAELLEFLKVGRLPDSPDNVTGVPMPGFAWMTAEQLDEVVAYVKQL